MSVMYGRKGSILRRIRIFSRMEKQIDYKNLVREIVTLTVAVFIIAAAVYFFLVPSHTSVSSISGLGIILTNFIPLPLSVITMVMNVVLLLIGFIT